MSDKRHKSTAFSINCNGKKLSLESPKIMGILNITPDSFYDGGLYDSEAMILKRVQEMVTDGASIIDIGATSTRPGAKDVSTEEEIARLLPALKVIRKEFQNEIISVDTYRSEVAEAAVQEGADIINDISGGELDENMFSVVAKKKVPDILMHMQGTPKTMQDAPFYEDVVMDITIFFQDKISELEALNHHNIILDPGFGFGKQLHHNYQILSDFGSFKKFGYPLLAGVSRKSMINRVLKTKPEDALNGTTVLNTIALLNGADILRVHDVKEAMEAIKLIGQYNELAQQ